MKRAFFFTATAAAAAFTFAAPLTVRACQYCRMALEDPESGRMITDNRGGSFPLDGAINQYQAAPVSADLKTAPAADSIVTSAAALTASVPPGANTPVVVHRPVLPPPAPIAAAVAAPAKAAASVNVAAAKPAPPVSAMNVAIAHWMDACLLGLVAAGGVFCWRTRRPAGDADLK